MVFVDRGSSLAAAVFIPAPFATCSWCVCSAVCTTILLAATIAAACMFDPEA